MPNMLTLAVAGSRKTQGIVEHCANLPIKRRALILTYTTSNQCELQERLNRFLGNRPDIQVMGWFTFLLRDFARPFLPFKFPNRRIRGLNFEGRPFRMAKGVNRFLDSNDSVYACELARLSRELIDASKGALIHRMECIYDEILIDEVQDLSGYDWEILDFLLGSSLDIRMVGDIRQSVLSTNYRSSKNKQYKYTESLHWFRKKQRQGILEIEESNTTWRCHASIATFSDTIFNSDWGFPKTNSLNAVTTGHDGIFLVREMNIHEYIKRYKPQCLRNSASSGKKYDFDFINFKVSKGRTFDRVLIVPTAGILAFVQFATPLEPIPAASFYVAVTRAKQSVAILIPSKGEFQFPIWEP